MACWDSPTSRPADDETRELRRTAHDYFDRLYGKGKRFRSRNAAYRWLKNFMRTTRELNHIGAFSKEQCRKLIDHLSADENVFPPLDSVAKAK